MVLQRECAEVQRISFLTSTSLQCEKTAKDRTQQSVDGWMIQRDSNQNCLLIGSTEERPCFLQELFLISLSYGENFLKMACYA